VKDGSPILTPDLCVVGAGSGGLSLAAAAAAFGASVVLVERGKMGGDCLNTGCIPSKALIAAARHAAAIRAAPAFGVSAGPVVVDFAAVMAHVRGVIENIAPADSVERFTGLGVQVIPAEARFLDRDTIVAGAHRIRARRIVLATGSRPRIPPIPGLDAVPFLTNETLFELTSLPAHLLIIGGGPVGLEMGQAFRRLGAAVTLIESGTILGKDDPELVAVLRQALLGEDVDIREAATVTGVAGSAGAITLTVTSNGGSERISGTHLLVAAGRQVEAEALDLPAAGIEASAEGIAVNARLRTANRRVYAIGDAIGGPQYTHRANGHAGLVARAILFRLPGREAVDRLPHVTLTEPGLGQVGLTEAEARERGVRHQVLTVPLRENDRAQADRRTDGMLKLVVGRGGCLLGAGIVGAEASELTNLMSLALSRNMGMRQLQGFISPYPSYGEIGKRAATAYFRPYARRGFIRRAVRFLARWN
jgi:pyruvate/2-oxoglutarate dehydrogenase complex dihydrolipoamide dehydrogenase (E3) component